MPLAVVGSNVVIEVNGKKVRGRQYPWGVAEGRFIQVHCQTGRTRLPSCGQAAKAYKINQHKDMSSLKVYEMQQLRTVSFQERRDTPYVIVPQSDNDRCRRETEARWCL